MAAFIFSIFGAQPLCIAGVTGPITVLNKTIYTIIERQENPPDYLQFVGWVYLWGAILHWITAALNCELRSRKVATDFAHSYRQGVTSSNSSRYSHATPSASMSHGSICNTVCKSSPGSFQPRRHQILLWTVLSSESFLL